MLNDLVVEGCLDREADGISVRLSNYVLTAMHRLKSTIAGTLQRFQSPTKQPACAFCAPTGSEGNHLSSPKSYLNIPSVSVKIESGADMAHMLNILA